MRVIAPLGIGALGAGSGTFSELLAQRSASGITVGSSAKMVEFGTKLAMENGIGNLEYRLAHLAPPPIEENSLDLAFFSQSLHHALHPQTAVNAAYRLLKPGGRIVILDLKRHNFEQARELYADTWLGFSEVELRGFLEQAHFGHVQSWIVDREKQTPAFETIL